MNASVFGYIVIDCTCIGTSLRLSFSLSFSLSISVSGYIVTDCTCIAVSLFLCLSQSSGILLVNLRVYVRLLIGISLSLFVSGCVKQCPNIVLLIVGVSVHLLIRVPHSSSSSSSSFFFFLLF